MDFSQLATTLQHAKHVLITTHRSPDGDAMGSSLALALVFKKAGISASLVIPNAFPDFLAWMPSADEAINFETQADEARNAVEKSDIIFCLDFNNLSRLHDFGAVVETSGKPLVLIDHHISPADYFLHSMSDVSASSTCEMMHTFFTGMGWVDHIDASVAECLYTGLMTDTGSFRFSSTSANTHRVVADLIERGLRPEKVYDCVFDTNRFERLQLIGHALTKKMEYREEFHTAIIPLSLREKNRYHYKKGDTEGLVNYGLSILGSRMSIFISEEDGYCKMSLRSKGELDVNAIARQHFNGGGHKNAAGGKLDLPIEETLKRIDEVLELHKSDLQ